MQLLLVHIENKLFRMEWQTELVYQHGKTTDLFAQRFRYLQLRQPRIRQQITSLHLFRSLQNPSLSHADKGSCYSSALKHLLIHVLYLQTESVTLDAHILSELEVRFRQESRIVKFQLKGQLRHILTTLTREMLKQHKRSALNVSYYDN
jgi:hypothetical protein